METIKDIYKSVLFFELGELVDFKVFPNLMLI